MLWCERSWAADILVEVGYGLSEVVAVVCVVCWCGLGW